MKVFLALSLLTLVLLSACAPQVEQPAAAQDAAAVENLGNQVSEVNNVESDLDPSGLDSIDKTLSEIETG